MIETTVDQFLGGSLHLRQPLQGFRSGSDAILLAASVPPSAKGRLLDVGCGTGVAAFAITHRLPSLEVHGLDSEEFLIEIARSNAVLNNKQASFYVQDIIDPLRKIQPQFFDRVISNPPYFKDSTPSPDPSRSKSRHYDAKFLQSWINFCVKMVKPRGFVHFIFPSSSFQELISNLLQEPVGGIEIFPLWPKKESEIAKRLIVIARKNVMSPTVFHKGIVLHEEENYTLKAQSILRDGKGLFYDDLKQNFK